MRNLFPLVTALMLCGCTSQPDPGFGQAPPPVESPSAVPPRVSDGPPQSVQVTAPGGFLFEPNVLQIRAGELTEFELANADSQDHTFVISELAVVMLAAAGQTVRSSTLIDRKNRGTFAFFCSIGGHLDAGMEGTIEVR